MERLGIAVSVVFRSIRELHVDLEYRTGGLGLLTTLGTSSDALGGQRKCWPNIASVITYYHLHLNMSNAITKGDNIISIY